METQIQVNLPVEPRRSEYPELDDIEFVGSIINRWYHDCNMAILDEVAGRAIRRVSYHQQKTIMTIDDKDPIEKIVRFAIVVLKDNKVEDKKSGGLPPLKPWVDYILEAKLRKACPTLLDRYYEVWSEICGIIEAGQPDDATIMRLRETIARWRSVLPLRPSIKQIRRQED